MKKALTSILITYCVIILAGPHGAGIPLIFVAIAAFFASLFKWDSQVIELFVYSFLILIFYSSILVARLKENKSKMLILSLAGIIGLNIELIIIIFKVLEEPSRQMPVLTAIPFWIASLIALMIIIKQQVLTPHKNDN